MKGPLPTSARRHTHALVMIDHGETVAIAFHNFIICRCGWPGDPSTSETQRRGPPLQPRKLAGDGLDSAFTTLSPLWRPSPLWRCPTNQCAHPRVRQDWWDFTVDLGLWEHLLIVAHCGWRCQL
eukprot:GHVN01076802.1.p1 GENE.GHVN01076802.1~~GHVN01076802.1.p1  ORF type:complete len:124 (+),score=7.38 GHVN01076802.1:841-1212(+)